MNTQMKLAIFCVCFVSEFFGSILFAQTLNIPTSMSESQVQSAVANAAAGTTIRFASGIHRVRKLEVKANNITIEGTGNLQTTIDGQYRGGALIIVQNRSDVTIRNLNLRGAESETFKGVVFGGTANRLVVEDCDIQVERTQGGVFLNGGGGQIIRNNRIYNPRAINFEFAADLVFIQNTTNAGWLIEGNTLNAQGRPTKYPSDHQRTLDEAIHVDNIQTLNCQGGTVNANTITIDIDLERHFHGVLIENGGGTYTVSNNYMINLFTKNNFSPEGQLDFILGLYGSTSSKYLVYHNTIVGNGEQLLYYRDTQAGSEFRNNIFYRRERGRGGPVVSIVSSSNFGQWSNNLFYNQGNPSDNVVGTNLGWNDVNEFEALVGGSGTIHANPQFVLEGPALTSSSPAKDAGTLLPSVGTDLDGNARDASPTIGAIELGGGPPEPPQQESISVDGPPIVSASGTEAFIIDYDANGTRDIILDIFDANFGWKAQRRIENVSGSGTWMGSLTYPNISTATGIVKVSLLPNGGSWQELLQAEFLDVEIAGSAPAPNFYPFLVDGTPGAGTVVHGNWGVSMGTGSWLRLNNVDLSTGYNEFAFRYASGASSVIEVRANSPTGQLLASISCRDTGSGSKQSATWTGGSMTPITGQSDIYIVIKSGYLNGFRCGFKNQ